MYEIFRNERSSKLVSSGFVRSTGDSFNLTQTFLYEAKYATSSPTLFF